jgi:hypothetical protein
VSPCGLTKGESFTVQYMKKSRTNTTAGWSETGITPTKSNPSIPNGQVINRSQSSYTNSYEDIVYSCGYGNFNDCSHYRRTTELPRPTYAYSVASTNPHYYIYKHTTPSADWDATAGTHGFGSATNPLNGLATINQYMGTQPVPPSVPDLDALLVNALACTLPGIKPKVSLINSLIELKDFRSLPRTLSRVRNLFKGLAHGKATLKELLKSSADSYLQSEFNIRPLIRDLQGIYSAVTGVRAQVERLYANELRYQTSHYRQSLSGLFPSSDVTVLVSPGLYQGFNARRKVSVGDASLVVTVDYGYHLKGVPKELAHIGALLDSLGVNFNPAIIWNAIPWTFVVDWVFDVSRWLDQFKIRNFEPSTVIYRCCYSIKVRRRIECFAQNSVNGPVSIMVPCSWVTEDSYHRRQFSPHLISSITSSGVNLKEFTLASALFLSRKLGKRHG